MRPIITLTLVGLIAASLLAIVDDMTRNPIALAKAEMKRKAIEQIFPFAIDSLKQVETEKTKFYEAYDKTGTLKGIAVESATTLGYSGKIEILLGVSPAKKIFDYKVVYHLETPGLGDKIDKPRFKEQFRERALEGTTWKVKKDGGDIDELTAATISSRAVTDAVERGLRYINEQYPKHEGK
ncbi:MAG: RnfABCDGE type electron transport complex subunit G [Chlorobium sp.]|jgi:electron transport complex protein RnfG|uniref:RnfABCDGE type electron transport complex subunit G n=1 Tax=Chlorobium sp. TaxID=1095 RepID=UPI001D2EFED9|nr:RnfABCDGE type electron transport complex subunit G [Chlorobium sp.]MBN1278620.1 RnfABCDGE type electron transport complex subunit G [Chlorobiaceae bacterium]MCF8216030.1 RnfABCDGE type electron transport complex subunit G [Chlorobium sp.]MCF8270931.1 RnfABCDGE type electron transport complex subunit G [Chlorobium sp.]MCF8287305.1 RnfABCDGE type electron transport complex subunit G [Chlorobium sp.]MCF8291680.1 RnfABCDGE type electron transport complex subunit G [Chlorobium sp.]